jgi:hypothetical protein
LGTGLKFLVAKKEKSDLILIGGPYNPSLDGPDPSDPQNFDSTLTRTAM